MSSISFVRMTSQSSAEFFFEPPENWAAGTLHIRRESDLLINSQTVTAGLNSISGLDRGEEYDVWVVSDQLDGLTPLLNSDVTQIEKVVIE